MNKQLKDCTDIEIKSFKCDVYEEIQQSQMKLEILNGELKRRAEINQLNENNKMENENNVVTNPEVAVEEVATPVQEAPVEEVVVEATETPVEEAVA